MAVQVSYPGVYIEEFAPAPPIQGVGTSTAAFIGAGISLSNVLVNNPFPASSCGMPYAASLKTVVKSAS